MPTRDEAPVWDTINLFAEVYHAAAQQYREAPGWPVEIAERVRRDRRDRIGTSRDVAEEIIRCAAGAALAGTSSHGTSTLGGCR